MKRKNILTPIKLPGKYTAPRGVTIFNVAASLLAFSAIEVFDTATVLSLTVKSFSSVCSLTVSSYNLFVVC